jgi:hypothetical protein
MPLAHTVEKKKLGQILIDRKLITPEQLQRALEYQKKDSRSLGEILHSFKLLNDEDLLKVLSIELGIDYFPTDILMDMDVQSNVLAFITHEKALELMVCPLEYNVESDALLVAMAYPQRMGVVEQVKELTGVARVEACLCFEFTLYRLVNKNYGEKIDDPAPAKAKKGEEDTGEGFFLGSEDDSEAFPGVFNPGSNLADQIEDVPKEGEGFKLGGEGKHGISGNLMDLGLLEMLQIMGASNKTCLIRITKGEEICDIYMENGRITNCMLGGKKGDEAFFDVIGWNEGFFHISPDETHAEKLIRSSLDGLILEGLRRLDEKNAQ